MFLLLILAFSFQICASAAGKVTINSLIEREDRYDKTLVTVRGEAIGEPMKRGNECWVNISDGTNAIGIKMKFADAQRIKKYGNYKQTGDTILVRGYFYKACPQDGGETDIHAADLKIVAPGKTTAEPVPVTKVAGTVLLAALMTTGLLLFRKKRME